MSPERSGDLERIAEAVSDGTPIDWEGEMAARPDLSDVLRSLSQLERVRETHGLVAAFDTAATETDGASTATAAAPQRIKEPAPLFLWGSFHVMERVGETAGSEVYRAFDPTLQTEFALKLRKGDDVRIRGAVPRSLSEARRLARVRHPNVLVVHGADEHDGRMGIWTDFVRGKSLEEYLRQEGPLSAREATLIGLDLCRALAAVHAAKLVHRDLKTGNVMREEGGRTILMDFGCVAEMPSAGIAPTGEIVGTAITMAPEQLRGQIAGPATDLYALGVLLYRLVSGQYPIEAESLSELAEKQRRGERVPLRDRRADLPLDFVQVVERALSFDPKRRYSSTGEMERSLASLLGAGHDLAGGGQDTRRREIPRWAVVAATVVVVLGFGFLIWANRPEIFGDSRRAATPPAVTMPTPTHATLTATATLFRRSGSKLEPLPASGARIKPGDQLSMDLRVDEPTHVYVLNEDIAGKVYVLFPIPGVSPTNPLSASTPYRLPGRMGDSLVFWTVTSAGGREKIATIASREPLVELERVIAQIPRAVPGRPVQYGELSPNDLGNLRGIGGLKKEAAVPEDTHRRLEETIQSLADRAKKVGDVWVWTISLENPVHDAQ